MRTDRDPMSKCTTDTRNYEIYLMRKAGMTLDEIGKKYGLTRERIRQLYELQRRKHEMINNPWPVFRKMLSTRSQKCLITHFGSEEIFSHPDEIASKSYPELLRIKNIGKKSIDEIIDALKNLGYQVNNGATDGDISGFNAVMKSE